MGQDKLSVNRVAGLIGICDGVHGAAEIAQVEDLRDPIQVRVVG